MKNLKYIFLTLIISAFFIASPAKATIAIDITKQDITGTTIAIDGKVMAFPIQQMPMNYFFFLYEQGKSAPLIQSSPITIDPQTLTFHYSINISQFTSTKHLFTYKIIGVYYNNTPPPVFLNSPGNNFDTSVTGGTHVISESRPPTVYTKDIINLTGLGATLVGTVQNNKNPVTVWFKYGLSSANLDAETTHKTLNSLYGDENYNQASIDFKNSIEKYKGQNMVEGTMYYYTACAENTFDKVCSTTVKTFSPKKVQVEITPVTLPPPNSDTTYQLLAPLPTKAGEGTGGGNTITIIDSTQGNVFGKYFNTMIRIFIGLCAVLSFVMIVIGGIEYVTSELMTSKEEGRKRIGNAIFGLLIALGSYVLLNTINPQLLDVSLSGINDASITNSGGFTNSPVSLNFTPPTGIVCPKAGGSARIAEIVNSLNGKVTYRFGGKGGPAPYPSDTKMCDNNIACSSFCPTGTICLDCTGFVDYVLECAGLNPPGGSSGMAFSTGTGLETITTQTEANGETVLNGQALKPGDVVGWTTGTPGTSVGHAFVYIGGGKAAESTAAHNGRSSGQAFTIFNIISKYGKIINHFKRI